MNYILMEKKNENLPTKTHLVIQMDLMFMKESSV